jgi:hypothetical protein
MFETSDNPVAEPVQQDVGDDDDGYVAPANATIPEDNGDEALELEAEGGDEQPEVEDPLDDVEYNGKQYKLPKELKEALLRQEDYTRKTQDVANQRRQVEQMIQAKAQEFQLQQQTIQGQAYLISVDQQLAQYNGVDWQRLSVEDPAEASRLYIARGQLAEHRQQVAAKVAQEQQALMHVQQQELYQRMQEGAQVLSRDIPGWSPEVGKALIEYGARSFGFEPAELQGVDDPRAVKVLHKAYLYDQMMAKKDAKPQPQAKPVTTVKGGKSSGAPTGYHKNMTDKQYAEWRARQKAAKK